MMKFCATVARVLVISVLVATTDLALAQQTYPTKPIRLIIVYSPGGSADIVARVVAQKLTERWGQPVIVENRPGGNTIIGNDAVAKAPPDGYTILDVASTFAILPGLLPNLPYDTIKDFAPICTLIVMNYVLVLNPSVPANNLQEFIALAKSRPGQLNYSSAGIGGVIHLAGELFNTRAGVNIQTIPYKGGAPAVAAVISGEVQASFGDAISVIPHIPSGKLRAVAASGATRMPTLPHVPTFAEAGLPDFEANTWHALLAPAGTPKAIVDKVSSEIGKILAMRDVKEKLASLGVEPFVSTPDQFGALLRADMAKYAKVIKSANIKFEN